MASTVHCDVVFVAGSWRELMLYVPQMSPFSPQEIIWNLMACGCNNILGLTPHNDVLAQC